MNGVQNKKACNLEKPFPGCMGRMVNLFDLSVGVSGNRLLSDKAHRDGSLFPRSRSDVAKMLPIGDQIEEKPIESELRRGFSNKKSNGTPMKMLIAQEMSKEMESKKQPGVVAKLMGLDVLPGSEPDSGAQRSQQKCHLQNAYPQPRTPLRYWQQESGFPETQMECEIHPCQEQKVYKDVYEVWQQLSRTKNIKEKLFEKGGLNERQNEEKMALVRQKFIEAKRLATDENIRQSKEFQDALEVLSSNKDLFLKFLQEPNSLFSQHLHKLQSIPALPGIKRITLLRPSKTMENNRFAGREKKSEQQMRKQIQLVEVHGGEKNKAGRDPVFIDQKADDSVQPTRIVVLKPSAGKTRDIRAVDSSPSSPRIQHTNDAEAQESREAEKEITQQMGENLSNHGRDETYPSSMFSNGYVGDESSCNRSENECLEGNLSDSEVITPTSRHSSDYINNRFGSPYSSPFSHASYSPESSVCREAKKRLSERWALMALNGSANEQRRVRRSSSTLGEMLALSDTKKSTRSSSEEKNDGELGVPSVSSSRPCGGESDIGEQTSCLTNRNKDEGGDDSPGNLLRSRSVSVSSTVYGTRLNVEVPDPEVRKSPMPKVMVRSKSGKSSFKGKVSSLFFSRNKKSSKEKSVASPLAGFKDQSQSVIAQIPGVSEQPHSVNKSDAILQCATNSFFEEALSPPDLGGASDNTSSASICVGPKQGTTIPREAGLSLAKPETSGKQGENEDEPSPISVLEAPFEEDANMIPQSFGNINSSHQGIPAHPHSLRSHLIDKSPPIESISRTPYWDDASSERATTNPLNTSTVLPKAEEEQDCVSFIKTLLSVVGLDNGELSNTVIARWHSAESPLDPSLMDRCFDTKENKGLLQHEGKCRQWRSNRKLLFDSFNVALVDISGCGSDASPWTAASSRTLDRLSIGSSMTVDQVWDRIKEWFSSESRWCSGENGGDNDSLVVESVVRKEVVGRGWVELVRLELDGIGKELEAKMLQELVEEAVVEFTGGF